MADPIKGIDHVVISVTDAAGAAEAFTRLGFTVSPAGRLSGTRLGTEGRGIMFQRNHIALIAPEAGRKDQPEGLALVAIGTTDMAALPVEVEESYEVVRITELPEGPAETRLCMGRVGDNVMPGLVAQFVQRLSDEAQRRADWLSHPNGAAAIQSITTLVQDPEDLMGAYDRLFGEGAATRSDSMVTVNTGDGLLVFATPNSFRKLHPDVEISRRQKLPRMAAITFTVSDPGVTAKVLAGRGIDYTREADGSVRVAPEDASGVLLYFARG
ncbi:MAG: VOC family protein [Alphaproteobacteria bacterium]